MNLFRSAASLGALLLALTLNSAVMVGATDRAAGLADRLPGSVRSRTGRSSVIAVRDSQEAAQVLSRVLAGVYLPASGSVRVFEEVTSLEEDERLTTLEAFVERAEGEVRELNAAGVEAILTFPFEVRLPAELARAIDVRQEGLLPAMPPVEPAATLFSETFEGSLSSSIWDIYGREGTYPDVTRCEAYQGSQSLDMLRGGEGALITCASTLFMATSDLFNVARLKNTTIVMGATSGTVSAYLKCDNNNARGGSFTGIAASTDGYSWDGYGTSGSLSTWQVLQKDVKSWSSLGDITGQPVHLGMLMVSPFANGWGARFDNFTVEATIPSAYTMSVAKSGAGSGTVTSSPAGINCGTTCSANMTTNQSVTLTATPAQGSKFGGWSGSCTGTSSTCKVTMSMVRNVTARFDIAPSEYRLTVAKSGSGSGTVTSSPAGIDCGGACSANFSADRSVALSAAANSGSVFAGWSGACSGTGACSMTMSTDRSVTAKFDTIPTYQLTVTKVGEGTGTVTSTPAGINCGSDCTASFASGQSVALTAAAPLPSTFGGWNGACSGTGACTVTMSQARSVTATFKLVAAGEEMPLSNKKISVRAYYRNQYSGEAGSAKPLPQDDAFGFFHFGDQNNPEVFVKVLDFGATSPYLVFYAGLTDFEYMVEFKNVSTGKTISFTKPPGSFVGGANNTDLPHSVAQAVLWSRDGENRGAVPSSGSLERGARLATLIPTSRDLPPEKLKAGALRRSDAVPAPNAKDVVLSKGKVAVSVSWRSQYSDQTGEGTPIPQKDEFAFFYFSNPGNPEVFVKVLDFGETSPYLLFYAGLTDFEYTVTFRHVETNQTVSFKKDAGTFNGGADNKTLIHAVGGLTFATLAGVSGGWLAERETTCWGALMPSRKALVFQEDLGIGAGEEDQPDVRERPVR